MTAPDHRYGWSTATPDQYHGSTADTHHSTRDREYTAQLTTWAQMCTCVCASMPIRLCKGKQSDIICVDPDLCTANETQVRDTQFGSRHWHGTSRQEIRWHGASTLAEPKVAGRTVALRAPLRTDSIVPRTQAYYRITAISAL